MSHILQSKLPSPFETRRIAALQVLLAGFEADCCVAGFAEI